VTKQVYCFEKIGFSLPVFADKEIHARPEFDFKPLEVPEIEGV
jgi:hypothetical protein